MAAEQELLLVVGAGDSLGRGFGSGQGRQQQACQDGDDGDDHQQFNQRESVWRAVLLVLSIHKPKQKKCRFQINCASNQFYPDSRKTQVLAGNNFNWYPVSEGGRKSRSADFPARSV